MAEYKVIQDIEAEDKLIGPLTMKQFIFACISAGSIFLAFMIASKTNALAFIPFLPFIIIPGVLAAPLGKDQPTDIWLSAKIRFLIKPRKRIWDQSGIKELVHITAPKKVIQQLTNNLNQREVKSRLRALADIIDSRGWAVKSEDINLFTMPSFETVAEVGSDRLIAFNNATQSVPNIDITAADDIMDAQSNNIAHHFDSMIKASTTDQRQAAIERMKNAVKNARVHAASSPSENRLLSYVLQPELPLDSAMFNEQIVAPHQSQPGSAGLPTTNKPASNEEVLLLKQFEHSHQQSDKVSQMISPKHKSIQPTEEPANRGYSPTQTVTPPKNPDIVNLAKTDFKVATIAGLANRKNPAGGGEVMVNLH
jgi:hypothetical protein